MPTIRLRSNPRGSNPRTIVMRPNINLVGVTRDGTGARLGNCTVYLFRTSDDAVRDRAMSDDQGNYGVTPYDYSPHYVVAIRTATVDSTVLTVDMTGITVDSSSEIDGVTANTLVGV